MDVEAADTNFGKFVPLHLLKFSSDIKLYQSFRNLIEKNYEKGIVKSEDGTCQACGCKLSNKVNLRMQPSLKRTSKISKLLQRQKNGTLFSKYNNFALQRFLKSCTQLNVKCSKCKYLNKQPLVSNEMKMAIKDNALKRVSAIVAQANPTPQKKKKKKKRKNKSGDTDTCGLTIPSTPNAETDLQRTPNQLATVTMRAQKTMPPQNSHCRNQLNNKPANKSAPPLAQTLSKKKPSPFNNRGPEKDLKSALKQKNLKKFLDDGQSEAKKTSLADFLSSL